MGELKSSERERAAEEKEILAAIRCKREAEEDSWDHRGDNEDEEHSSPTLTPPDLRPQISGILNHGSPANGRIGSGIIPRRTAGQQHAHCP
jgi:hypothetical protein